MDKEFCLVSDNDGHWYVIPTSMSEEWNDWLETDPDDEAAWEVPYYAEMIGGSPSLVKFEYYRID